MKKKIAQIAIIKPLHSLFDYEIPESMESDIKPGCRVSIEFGRKLTIGFVINIKNKINSPKYNLKKIQEIIDKSPVLDQEILKLLMWVSNYYHSPLGQIIGLATPLYLRQGKIIEDYSYDDFESEGFIEQKINLSNEQKNAVKNIKQSLFCYECFLLDGITGSGKTEVYKHIQNEIHKKDLQTLIIVPEKTLIPGLIKYFKINNLLRVVEYHSSLTPKQKFINWTLIQNCEVDIIIGTRSSVFLKIPNLGLIIIDEEHDVSLKNSSEARYNSRDVAIYRAKSKNIPIILGSATPSSETIFNVTNKKFTHIKMRKRINEKPLPILKIVDMSKKKNAILSDDVIKAVKNRLLKKEQTLIYLNRRGYSPVINCRDCSWIPKCSQCNLNMTFHKNKKLLICHHCAINIKFSNKCLNCNSKDIAYLGEGTEKIEEVIRNEFKKTKIIRIDSDNTRKKGEAEKIFKDVKLNKYDILIGTQMLSKGHNFPNITLVVIMNIDQSLYSPRLKAFEQLAQQLIQVSGRSGRGKVKGEVILQTSYPDNENLSCLIKHGYEEWMKQLLKLRKNLSLPPYKNWGVIQAKSKKYEDAENFLYNIKKILNKGRNIEIYGPMPSIMQKKANLFNLNLIVQAENKKKLNYIFSDCIPLIKDIPYSNKIRWSIDIDPIDYD